MQVNMQSFYESNQVNENQDHASSSQAAFVGSANVEQNNNRNGLIFEVKRTSSRLFDAKKQREKQRKLREQKQKTELKGCTFKPKINNRKEPDMSRKSIGDKLYQDGQLMKKNKDQLIKETIRKEKENLTFMPRINKTPDRKSTSSVFERLANENKLEKLAKLKREKLQNELKECTFAPILSYKKQSERKNSNRISGTTSKNDGVFKRLERDNSDRLQKQTLLSELKISTELKACTFDARKTIHNLREQQEKETKKRVEERLQIQTENLTLKSNAAKSSIEVGPSCFQQALSLVRFSAKTLSKQEYQKLTDKVASDEENCPQIQNTNSC